MVQENAATIVLCLIFGIPGSCVYVKMYLCECMASLLVLVIINMCLFCSFTYVCVCACMCVFVLVWNQSSYLDSKIEKKKELKKEKRSKTKHKNQSEFFARKHLSFVCLLISYQDSTVAFTRLSCVYKNACIHLAIHTYISLT